MLNVKGAGENSISMLSLKQERLSNQGKSSWPNGCREMVKVVQIENYSKKYGVERLQQY